MAQPKVFIEAKEVLEPKHNTTDDHDKLVKQITAEVQYLKKQSRRLKDSLTNHEHLVIFVHGFNNTQLQMNESNVISGTLTLKTTADSQSID